MNGRDWLFHGAKKEAAVRPAKKRGRITALRLSFFDPEQAAQDSTEHFWGFPDNDFHNRSPFLSSAAGTAAGDQKKRDQKQQRSHGKNDRNQNTGAQGYRKDTQKAVSTPAEHSSHAPFFLFQYIQADGPL
jgi:hypothetical protein